ncbi:MAG: hypothetical protein OXR73_19735 [Myxococcales bacterium]|nr:hypothetical protein [Myxococcales bacterium]
MQLRSMVALVALLGATVPQLASAQLQPKTVTVPGPGRSMIGNFRLSTNPEVWQHVYHFEAPNGQCGHFTSLGDSESIIFSVVTIEGTQWNDNIQVATTPTTFCGMQVQPAVLNGNQIVINGHGGNDSIHGGTTITGGDGVDFVVAVPGMTGDIQGEGGNDKLWPANGVFVFGGSGDDRTCVQTRSDYILGSGGSGADQHFEDGDGFLLSSTLVSEELWNFLCF